WPVSKLRKHSMMNKDGSRCQRPSAPDSSTSPISRLLKSVCVRRIFSMCEDPGARREQACRRRKGRISLVRADAIAGMPSGAAIDCRAAISIILRDVRRATALAAARDKVGGVIVLVTSYRAAGSGVILDHVERRRALGRPVGLGQP